MSAAMCSGPMSKSARLKIQRSRATANAAVPLIEHQQNRILEPAAFFSPILDAMVAAAAKV